LVDRFGFQPLDYSRPAHLLGPEAAVLRHFGDVERNGSKAALRRP
jgi:hypothetical protein